MRKHGGFHGASMMVAVCFASTCLAEVRLASLFGDGMVLQRDIQVPVSGWAEPGEQVAVSFAGQTASGVADADGRWRIALAPLGASKAPAEMSVTGSLFIHPLNKQDVGLRLALLALSRTYKRDIVHCGPLYAGMAIEGHAIRITFDHVGSGLMIGEKAGLDPVNELPDGQVKWIAIAGADMQWHWADMKIDGDTVLVSSEAVPDPVAVRYAYTANPVGPLLYNREGLPASPFTTESVWQ